MQLEPGDLLVDTRVHDDPERPNRLHASISSAWNVLYVFGGVTMATAFNAARARLSRPELQPLCTTATFLSPVQAGALELEVRTLRQGKGSEQLAVDLYERRSESPSLHLVSTFGPPRDDLNPPLVDLAFPDVPMPGEIAPHVPRESSAMLMVPYYHSVETRVAKPRTALAEGNARWFGWQRFKKTPRLADGSLDPIAYIPTCDMIGPALRNARGKGKGAEMVVSLEISLHFFAQTDSEWLLQDAHIYQAGGGYTTGIVHLWDEHKRLVGHALQRALLRPRAF